MVAKKKMPAKKKVPAKKKAASSSSTKSKNPASKRDYDKEYARDQKKRSGYRAELNKANREAGTYGNGDGKDRAHVKDVRKGGKASGKTVAKKASTNRAWRKDKKGYDRGKG